MNPSSRQLMTELQSFGLRLADPGSKHGGVASRRGGAGPSDHKAVTIDGHTIMVPVHTQGAWNSPFVAEVARAAVLLDGVKHMVMTTGTPATPDRGAQVLVDSAFAIRSAVDLPIQAQCEPPDTDQWFVRMKAAGIDTLGMHLEVVTPAIRERVMPGKASVPVSRYMESFEAAVAVFGRGQVSTYILAGLGDTREAILAICEQLVAIGVYPFVVPFVPISGTPLEDHPAPSPEFMKALLEPLGRMVSEGRMRSADIKAGCGKCGACSSLSVYEV